MRDGVHVSRVKSTQPKSLQGLAFANVAILFFGLAGVLGKLSVLPAPLIVFGRTFFAGFVLLAVCWFWHIPLRAKRSRALQVEKDALCLWAFSAGVPFGLRTAMRNAPTYIRGIVAYYGPVDLRPMSSIRPGMDTLLQELSPICYLEEDVPNGAPIFIMRAGLNQPDINVSVDNLIAKAFIQNVSVTAVNHPTGHHGFDILDDDERSREIIKPTLDFVRTRLNAHHA